MERFKVVIIDDTREFVDTYNDVDDEGLNHICDRYKMYLNTVRSLVEKAQRDSGASEFMFRIPMFNQEQPPHS